MAPYKTLKSDSQKLEHTRKLARERQRRRRAKLSGEELELKRLKERERYAQLKKGGKIKLVKDLTPREHRKVKKVWRDYKRKRKSENLLEEKVTDETPPDSEAEAMDMESTQKKRGREKVRKDKASCYRQNKKLESEIKKLKRKLEKYKKRVQREKKKTTVNQSSPSPAKKVSNILGTEKVSPKIKKQLFLGYALEKQLKCQLDKVPPNSKRRQLLCKAIGNDDLKKYRVQNYYKKNVPYTFNKRMLNDQFEYSRKKKNCIREEVKSIIKNLFEDDTVSKMCPGKKDFVRIRKLKIQRRILLDNKQNLYKRFVDEHKIKVSYSTFMRCCPSWVTPPKKSDRETCACVKHTNFEFKVSALKKVNVIQEKNSSDVLKTLVCDVKNEQCMLNICRVCENKTCTYTYDHDFKIKYHSWKNIKIKKKIKGKAKIIKKVVKIKECKSVTALIKEFQNDLKDFKRHVYYNIHQSSQLKKLRSDLRKEELIFRIDFSQNYVCKYNEEIQSAHFGASKKQISLHTGVIYAKDVVGKIQVLSFCTVSNNQDHQAHAVWAHLTPILKRMSKEFPNIKTVHFYSDSPSNQYRNRINIHLMKSTTPKIFKELRNMTWNFTESGHGKGPMDGIGGTLKRRADENVNHGSNVTSARDFVNLFKNSKVIVIEIPENEVTAFKFKVNNMNIPAIANIMQIHQITWTFDERMYGRILSCFKCKCDTYCEHYTINRVFNKDSDLFETKQTIPIKIKSRNGNKNEKKPRSTVNKSRKKLSVYTSIYSTSESEEDMVDLTENHKDNMIDLTKNHKEIQNKKLQINNNPTVSGTSIRLEEEEDVVTENDEPTAGSWVIVQYASKKEVFHHFIGQITDNFELGAEIKVPSKPGQK